MEDLGSGTGGTAISLGTKVLEAILRLLEKLFDAWRNNPERKLAKQKLKIAKNDLEKQKIIERLEGKTGYVNYQDLKRSGESLKAVGIFMTKAEMKEFSALCKREGVQFSGMTDNTKKNEDGVKTYEIICKEKDLDKVANIIDRMNDEKMIVGIDNRIAELESKGEEITEQDKVDIAALKEQKSAIQRSYCDMLNVEMSSNVINRVVTGEAKQNLTLDEALNRLTGRHIDKDTVCIVADANDPSKYIKCHGYQDTYKDQDYIKTEYEVFRGTESVLKTHDGRFDGRPKDYWNKQKAEIQQAGEFSGTFFKFASVVEYQKWAEETRNKNEQELSSMEKSNNNDFDHIIEELEAQLDENGAMMKDGVVVDKETGEPLTLEEGVTEEQKVTVVEYMAMEAQLDENGATMKDGVVVDKETGEPLTLEEGMTEEQQNKIKGCLEIGEQINGYFEGKKQEEQRANVAECVVIGKQISNYKELSQLELDISMAQADVLTTDEGTEERADAEAKLADMQTRMDTLRATEKGLINERKEINAVQSEQEIRTDVQMDIAEKLEYLPEDKAKIEELEKKIGELFPHYYTGDLYIELEQVKTQAAENARKTGRTVDSRSERVADKSGKQMSMEEAKKEIAQQRANDAAKSVGGNEKTAQEHSGKAKAKSGKTHGTR